MKLELLPVLVWLQDTASTEFHCCDNTQEEEKEKPAAEAVSKNIIPELTNYTKVRGNNNMTKSSYLIRRYRSKGCSGTDDDSHLIGNVFTMCEDFTDVKTHRYANFLVRCHL